MRLHQLEDLKLVFDHTKKKIFCVIEEKENKNATRMVEVRWDYGSKPGVYSVGKEVSDIRPNKKNAFYYFNAGMHYEAIFELLNSKIIESHSVDFNNGYYPGNSFNFKLKGLNTPIYCFHELNEVQEPFYKMEGKVPLFVLQWLQNMYDNLGIKPSYTKETVSPRIFSEVDPMVSVAGTLEAENTARLVMLYLEEKNDNKFREVTWEEYRDWQRAKGAKFDDDKLKKRFDKVAGYCISPVTAKLFSKAWKDILVD